MAPDSECVAASPAYAAAYVGSFSIARSKYLIALVNPSSVRVLKW